MRVLIQRPPRIRQSNLRKERDGMFLGIAVRRDPVVTQDAGQLLADCEHWVQRCARILKDHGDALASNAPDLGCRESGEVDPIKNDLTGDLGVRWDEPDNRATGHGLSTSRFTHESEHASPFDVKRDGTHGHRGAKRRRKCDVEVPQFEDWLRQVPSRERGSMTA
jgi:hypothetical protein